MGLWAAATWPGPGSAWSLTWHLILDHLVPFTQGSFIPHLPPPPPSLTSSLPLFFPHSSFSASKAVINQTVHSQPYAGSWGWQMLHLTSEFPDYRRGCVYPPSAVRGGPNQPARAWMGGQGSLVSLSWMLKDLIRGNWKKSTPSRGNSMCGKLEQQKGGGRWP